PVVDAGQQLRERQRVGGDVELGVPAAARLRAGVDLGGPAVDRDGEGARLRDRDVVVERRGERGRLRGQQRGEQRAGGLRVVVGELDDRAAQARVLARGAARRVDARRR